MLLTEPRSMQPRGSGRGVRSAQILPSCSSKPSRSPLRDRADPRPSLTLCPLLRSPPAGSCSPGAHSFPWSIRAEQKLPLPVAGGATAPSPRWLSGTRLLLPRPQREPCRVTHGWLPFLLSPRRGVFWGGKCCPPILGVGCGFKSQLCLTASVFLAPKTWAWAEAAPKDAVMETVHRGADGATQGWKQRKRELGLPW